MNRFFYLGAYLFMALFGSTIYGAESTLTEKEAPLLMESQFADAVKKGNSIVMYYTSDDTAKGPWGMTPVQQGDYWMRGMLAFRERLGSAIKFYRVNWKGFSPESISRIKSDLTATANYPDSPAFAVYTKYNTRPSRVRTPGRPDMFAWFIHDAMDDFMPIAKKNKAEYLYTGWLVTDMQSDWIHVVNERKEEIDFNGKSENVHIISFLSKPHEGFSCAYERIHARDGSLIGSIESYGPHGKFGYFDYDRTGKFQYRVTYPAGEGK